MEVHWHAVYAMILTALPVLLDRLGYIDLQPIFEHFMSPEWAALLVGCMPLVLAFLKPMVAVSAPEDTQ
jgi:hypothetical protein